MFTGGSAAAHPSTLFSSRESPASLEETVESLKKRNSDLERSLADILQQLQEQEKMKSYVLDRLRAAPPTSAFQTTTGAASKAAVPLNPAPASPSPSPSSNAFCANPAPGAPEFTPAFSAAPSSPPQPVYMISGVADPRIALSSQTCAENPQAFPVLWAHAALGSSYSYSPASPGLVYRSHGTHPTGQVPMEPVSVRAPIPYGHVDGSKPTTTTTTGHAIPVAPQAMPSLSPASSSSSPAAVASFRLAHRLEHTVGKAIDDSGVMLKQQVFDGVLSVLKELASTEVVADAAPPGVTIGDGLNAATATAATAATTTAVPNSRLPPAPQREAPFQRDRSTSPLPLDPLSSGRQGTLPPAPAPPPPRSTTNTTTTTNTQSSRGSSERSSHPNQAGQRFTRQGHAGRKASHRKRVPPSSAGYDPLSICHTKTLRPSRDESEETRQSPFSAHHKAGKELLCPQCQVEVLAEYRLLQLQQQQEQRQQQRQQHSQGQHEWRIPPAESRCSRSTVSSVSASALSSSSVSSPSAYNATTTPVAATATAQGAALETVYSESPQVTQQQQVQHQFVQPPHDHAISTSTARNEIPSHHRLVERSVSSGASRLSARAGLDGEYRQLELQCRNSHKPWQLRRGVSSHHDNDASITSQMALVLRAAVDAGALDCVDADEVFQYLFELFSEERVCDISEQSDSRLSRSRNDGRTPNRQYYGDHDEKQGERRLQELQEPSPLSYVRANVNYYRGHTSGRMSSDTSLSDLQELRSQLETRKFVQN